MMSPSISKTIIDHCVSNNFIGFVGRKLRNKIMFPFSILKFLNWNQLNIVVIKFVNELNSMFGLSLKTIRTSVNEFKIDLLVEPNSIELFTKSIRAKLHNSWNKLGPTKTQLFSWFGRSQYFGVLELSWHFDPTIISMKHPNKNKSLEWQKPRYCLLLRR